MRVLAAAALLLLIAAPLRAGEACTLSEEGGPVASLQSSAFALSYRLDPPDVQVGQIFSADIVLCDRDGETLEGPLAVDAVMPDHGHGMNTRPEVTSLGDGRFRADGYLFHMPGRWQFSFRAQAAGDSGQVTSDLVVE